MAFQFPANPTLGQQFAPIQGTTYEWNGTGWIHLGLNTASLYPAGIVLPYAGPGPTLPFQGWLLCDGATYATSALPVLFAVIGYRYGGSGVNFQVPDLRGRVVAGPDSMGTATGLAGRIGGSLTPHGAQLAAAGGTEVVTLTTDQLPVHAHGISDVAHSHSVTDPGHAHTVNNHQHGISDPGHTHGNDAHGHSISDPTHAHGNAAHTHGINDPGHTHGYVESSQNPPGNNFALQGPGPGQVWKDNSVSAIAFTGISTQGATVGIAASGTGIGINANTIAIHAAGTGIGVTQGLTAGLNTLASGTSVGIAASGTGLSTTNNAGGNNYHFNVQPTLTLNYIIKT